MRRRTAILAMVLALALTACGRGFGDQVEQQHGKVSLQLLMGSATTAEARVLHELTARWAARTGHRVDVARAADLEQQLGQAFAGGSPPDLFYLAPGDFGRYVQNGSLLGYGDRLRTAHQLYPNLNRIFTHKNRLYCAAKDFSTLALIINTDAWQQAGLTDRDLPSTWDDLAEVAERLTTPQRKGLAFDDTIDRVGAFLRQAGGWLLDPTETRATVDTPENLTALRFVQRLLRSGSTAFSSTVDAGWGGEAVGKGTAAMAIDGAWTLSALRADYPDRNWRAVQLPAGPAGKGNLSFTNCWGIPANSSKQAAAISLVNFLTGTPAQRKIGNEQGVIPANRAAARTFLRDNPEFAGFVAAAPYAQGEITVDGFQAVMDDFDSRMLGLAQGGDPKQILVDTQRNAEHVLGR